MTKLIRSTATYCCSLSPFDQRTAILFRFDEDQHCEAVNAAANRAVKHRMIRGKYMMNVARSMLPAYALQILRPAWIDGKPSDLMSQHDLVWSGQGLHDIPIYARRDGFIIFDFPRSASYSGGEVPSHEPVAGVRMPENIVDAQKRRARLRYQRLQYMNAFLACLYSGYSTIQKTGTAVQPPITPTTYFSASEQVAGHWQIYRHGGPDLLSSPSVSSPVLQSATVAHATELMMQCYGVLSDTGIVLVALVYMACHQYGNHQFDSAHLIAWSACEMLINRLWSDLLKDLDVRNGGHTVINGQRRKQLEGRDFTASIVSQSLSLHGKLDDEMLARLDDARRKRNAFAHSLEPVSSDDVGKAIRTATDLMTHVIGSRITSQLSYSSND